MTPNCRAKVIVNNEQQIVRKVGKHNHKKIVKKWKKSSMMGDLFRKNLKTMSEQQGIQRIKKHIGEEIKKLDSKRKLREALLRRMFIHRLKNDDDLCCTGG